MNHRAITLCAALLALVAGCGTSIPPLIIGLDDRTTQVGSLLEQVVRATVPGTITLEKPYPAAAQLVPLSGETATAMLRWIPLASDVGTTTLSFAIDVGGQRATESMVVTVLPSEIGRPQFIGTPYNALLDLAVTKTISIPIKVKDDDDTNIVLDVVPEFKLENSDLKDVTIEGKGGTFVFTPSEEQMRQRCSFGAQLFAKDSHGAEVRAGVFIELRNGCGAEPSVLINEILFDPQTDLDANGDKKFSSQDDEFIEIVNISTSDVEIGGATLSDAVFPPARFTFPTPTTLKPRQSAVVFGGGTPTGLPADVKVFAVPSIFGGQGLSLNNTGDTVTLRSSDGSIIDSVTYPSACVSCPTNVHASITRQNELSRTSRFIQHDLAQGAAGRRFSPGRRANGAAF